MRLSTSNLFDASIANLQRRQQQMQDSQAQLTSGKRIATASDDPTGAARAERALAAIGRVDANQRALEASRNGMTLSEAALGDANEILQQVRETMIAAGNASYSDAERAGLANKIAGLRDQLRSAEIVETADGDVAGMGTTVTYKDEKSGKELSHKLVPKVEADPSAGLISIDSPVGKALAGTKVGDDATLETPSGTRTMRVLAVEHS